MTYYKVLDGQQSCYGGSATWQLWQWMPEIKNITLCSRGYHLCQDEQVLKWLGQTIYEAEIHPNAMVIKASDKIIVSCCRIVRLCEGWTERTARLFACTCASHALRREARVGCKPDSRTYTAIRVARQFAKGQASAEEMVSARNAAYRAPAIGATATGVAFCNVTQAAEEQQAGAARTARAAAWIAACDAAWDAAGAPGWDTIWDAAQSAAWDAERAWQWTRLQRILR